MGSEMTTVYGVTRPVGAPFLQKEMWAAPIASRARKDRARWIVSTFEEPSGRVIEAHSGAMRPVTIINRGYEHSTRHDPDHVVKLAAEQIEAGAEGWVEGMVKACEINGCLNPLPMWSQPSPNQSEIRECVPCSLRSIVECAECGGTDELRTYDRHGLLDLNRCWRCHHWMQRADCADGAANSVVTVDYFVYSIGGGNSPDEHSGHGGLTFLVTWSDESRGPVETSDLWAGGQVPEDHRHRFTPNATVVWV